MEEQADGEKTAASRALPTDDGHTRETPRKNNKTKKKKKREKKGDADHARVSRSPRIKSEEETSMYAYDGGGGGPLFIDPKLRAEMDLAKRMYPGASTWATDEERLFEMLFLREELPILPSHWGIDFRGVPISERSFSSSSHGPKPIVYAHIKEFRATMALTRLIDLTANVRTACQSGLRRKAPAMIKKSLDSYMRWATEDGGFSYLKVVPNMVAEIIDSNEGEASVASIIEDRMRRLAGRQREYPRDERRHIGFAAADDGGDSEARSLERQRGTRRRSSWRAIGSMLMTGFLRLFETRIDIKPDPDEAGEPDGAASDEMVLVKVEEDSSDDSMAERRGQQEAKVKEEEDEDTVMTQLPSAPSASQPQSQPGSQPESQPESQQQSQQQPPQQPQQQSQPSSPSSTPYLRPPPVVYGLFIVNTVVFLMTVDSAKGDSAFVSFHVQTDFADRGQSVWNALTMAMVVCIARGEMMSRLEDFEQASVVEESDPDA